MPYTEAFIMEILRISSIIPLGVGHSTMEDFTFHGYDIPKGTQILSNIFAVHHDPKIWGDPEIFRPERFLKKDGRTVEKNDNLIPFSTGKRICLGFNLALDEIFLFATSLVQKFDISVEAGKPMPTLEPKGGQITLLPHPYSVVMKERR
jgi:cytochrome P450